MKEKEIPSHVAAACSIPGGVTWLALVLIRPSGSWMAYLVLGLLISGTCLAWAAWKYERDPHFFPPAPAWVQRLQARHQAQEQEQIRQAQTQIENEQKEEYHGGNAS